MVMHLFEMQTSFVHEMIFSNRKLKIQPGKLLPRFIEKTPGLLVSTIDLIIIKSMGSTAGGN